MKMIWIISLGLAVTLAACGKKASDDDQTLGLSLLLLSQQRQDANAEQALAVQMEAQAAMRGSGLSAANLPIRGGIPFFPQNAEPHAIAAAFSCSGGCPGAQTTGTFTLSGSQACAGGGLLRVDNVTYAITRSDATGYSYSMDGGSWTFDHCVAAQTAATPAIELNGTLTMQWRVALTQGATPGSATVDSSGSFSTTDFILGATKSTFDLKFQAATALSQSSGGTRNQVQTAVQGTINGKSVSTSNSFDAVCTSSGCKKP